MTVYELISHCINLGPVYIYELKENKDSLERDTERKWEILRDYNGNPYTYVPEEYDNKKINHYDFQINNSGVVEIIIYLEPVFTIQDVVNEISSTIKTEKEVHYMLISPIGFTRFYKKIPDKYLNKSIKKHCICESEIILVEIQLEEPID